MSHQNEIIQVVVLYHVQNVLNSGFNANVLGTEMDSFSHPRQSDGMDFVSLLLELWNDLLPSPPSQPSTWHKDERCHASSTEMNLSSSYWYFSVFPTCMQFGNPGDSILQSRFGDIRRFEPNGPVLNQTSDFDTNSSTKKWREPLPAHPDIRMGPPIASNPFRTELACLERHEG